MRGNMYRTILSVCLLFLSLSLVWAINEETAGFQMDTNMSETMLQKQNDSTLRFLQALTNQQEEIQNLNLALQQEKRKTKIERENLTHRISFITFLMWGVLAINGILLFVIIIISFRLKSFSNQIISIQVEMDAIQTEMNALSFEEKEAPSPKLKLKNQKQPSEGLDLSPSEEQELEGLLSSEADTSILSDSEGQNFFNKFQGEIDRERSQLIGKESEKSENDLLDELIEQHFSDTDIVSISSKDEKQK